MSGASEVRNEPTRALLVGGLFAWLMVGLPVLVHARPGSGRFLAWLCAYLVFGGAFWRSLHARSPPASRARLAVLLAQVAGVIAMTALLCDGYEGLLLVLVGMQIAPWPRAQAVAWMTAQSAGLAAAVSFHWSARAAVMLLPPYLGLQVLGFFTTRLLHREASARRMLAAANTELVLLNGLIEERGRLAERERIARELHDAMGHHLTALSLNLEVGLHLADRAALPHLETAQSLARLLLTELHDAIEASPDGLDVAAAMRGLQVQFPRPRVHLDVPAVLAIAEPERALCLVRCAQELVTNAVRHADADNLWLEVSERGGTVELRVRDDGRGAAALESGRGLRGLEARLQQAGGALRIETAPHRGLLAVATLPARKGPE